MSLFTKKWPMDRRSQQVPVLPGPEDNYKIIPVGIPCPLQRKEQASSPTSPPVLPTGQEHSQQVEGEKYAQAKEHPANVGLSYGEGNRR